MNWSPPDVTTSGGFSFAEGCALFCMLRRMENTVNPETAAGLDMRWSERDHGNVS
jgi:hypothetical protein